MLSDDNIAALAKGDAPANVPALPKRSLEDAKWKSEWASRYGWDRADAVPPALTDASTLVRKVQISDAYDVKRWWWKGTDGIRETTWPGVFNHSRLPGRADYFILPDWDCYSISGRSVTFTMPDEPWNQIEIAGAAWGKMELLAADAKNDAPAQSQLFEKPKGHPKTINRLPQSIRGQKMRFTNVEAEEPIGELVAYNVTAGREPEGTAKLTYRLSKSAPNASLSTIVGFIRGRYAADERSMLLAEPVGGNVPPSTAPALSIETSPDNVPLVHILIPDTWDSIDGGLDGIAIDLPALSLRATHGDVVPMNIQVKDPLWLMRDMMDFTFSVRPGQARTLWLDLRDRILPANAGFLIDIAAAGSDFNASMLEGAQVRLIFKSREAARPEHELDRFTQVRDNWAMMVEERPRSPRLNLWNRFSADLNDLIRVNPNHIPGRDYAAVNNVGQRPTFTQPTPPAGVPLWAFRQVELLKRVKGFVNWYIDHRQIENGELGGGLSDDTDLTNTWPGVALMGGDPDKVGHSLHMVLEACYSLGMFTDGLPTIQTDELHTYEEGINALAEVMILEYGNPKQIERAMEVAKGLERITGITQKGHRHVKTAYYSATKMAEEYPWGVAKPYSYLVFQPDQMLVDFNGNPRAKKVLMELVDGLLAHRTETSPIPSAIDFKTDEASPLGRDYFPWHMYWGAYKWTGDKKYLSPISDAGQINSINANVLDLLELRNEAGRSDRGGAAGRAGRGGRGGGHTAWQLTGDKSNLERLYASQIEECEFMNYINTEGSLWIDRVNVPHGDLQKARLGGIALTRNSLFPGHTVSWRFAAPGDDEKLAILIPDATRTSFKIIAYNLNEAPLRATMTGWEVDPGQWELTQGIDADNNDVADQAAETRTITFGRTNTVELTFAPRATTVLTFKLKTPGTPYWSRPDWGIGKDDVKVSGNEVKVTLHSLGSVETPSGVVSLMDASGKAITSLAIPAMKAPVNLDPQRLDVTFKVLQGVDLKGATIAIDPDLKVEEITRMNNRVGL
jgi:hypothetical protein